MIIIIIIIIMIITNDNKNHTILKNLNTSYTKQYNYERMENFSLVSMILNSNSK